MGRSLFWVGLLLVTAGLWAMVPEFETRRHAPPGNQDPVSWTSHAGWVLLALGLLFLTISLILRLRQARRFRSHLRGKGRS